MLSSSKLLLSTCLLSLFTTLASASCTGIVGIIASAIAGDAAAGSFCSSKFPQPAKSITLSASTVTVTGTDTITVSVASAQQKRKRAPTTSNTTGRSKASSSKASSTNKLITSSKTKSGSPTTTTGSSSTTLSTATGCAGNAKSCALSTLLSTAQSVASAICSCIEVPQTSTITPSAITVTTFTTTTTTATLPPQGTACYATQIAQCAQYPLDFGTCGCVVGIEQDQAYCFAGHACYPCTTDLQCDPGEVCAYDGGVCARQGQPTGGTICIVRGGDACQNAMPSR